MKKSLTILILICSISSIFAQNIIITGQIIDKTTNKELPFANIRVGKTPYGCISNEEGNFRLVMPSHFKDSVLLTTYIGYFPSRDTIKNLKSKNLIIVLVPVTTELPVVDVVPPDPIDILSKAIMSMSENYWSTPIIADAFYREIIFENDKAKRLSEAACNYYLAPYRSLYNLSESRDQIYTGNDYVEFDTKGYLIDIPPFRHPENLLQIKEVRTSNDMSATMTQFYITGGPMGGMCCDVLNHHYRWALPLEENYNKTYKSVKNRLPNPKISYSEWNNRPIFIINSSNEDREWTFYIDRKTNAIIQYDYFNRWDNIKTIPAMNKQYVKRKIAKEKISTDSTRISVQYMLSNEKWYISSITAKSHFTYYPYKGSPINLRTEREIMINNIKQDNVIPFNPDSCFSNNAFVNMFNYPTDYNDEFWNSYNSLYPTSLQAKIKEDLEVYQPLADQYSSKFSYIADMEAPNVKSIADTLFINQDTFPDNYRWLQYGNQDTIKAYIEKENAYCDNYFIKQSTTTRAFLEEIGVKYNLERFERKREPDIHGEWKYYFDKEYGEQGAFVRENISSDKKEVLIDMKKELDNYPQFDLAGYGFNPDTTVFFYTCLPYGQDASFDIQTIFLDLNTLLPIDTIAAVVGTWFNNKDFCHYMWSNEDYCIKQCYYKTIGEHNSQLLFQVDDDKKLNVWKSESNKTTFLMADDGLNTQLYYINDSSPLSVMPIGKQDSDVYCIVEQYKNDDSFYILSNENAPNFNLHKISPDSVGKSTGTLVIPEMTDIELVSAYLIDSIFVIKTLEGINQSIQIYNPKDQSYYKIPFNDEFYYASIKDIENDKFTIKYQTYLNPTKYFEYTISSRSMVLIGEDKIENYNPNDYKVKIEYASGIDGKEIPIVLISFKHTKRGKSPLFLQTYGGGGSSYYPSFNPAELPLLNRGVTIGYAIIRGGGETGTSDMLNARRENQILNVEDFASCSKHLIKENITSPDNLFVYGKSNGGYILAYSLVNHPELFKGMILDVPFCDLLTELSDSSSNENKYNYHTWGSPYIPTEYEMLKKLDAYQNIKAQDYPNILFLGAWQDINVKPSASIKMVAKLRENKTDDNILLLRILMNSGHTVNEGLQNKKMAMIYSFIFSCLED